MRLVALQLRDPADFWDAFEAHRSAGYAVLPLDPRLPESATRAIIERMQPSILVGDTGARELEGGGPVEEGTAVVLLTSGSTGEPKGVVLAADALAASIELTHERLGAQRGERWLTCLPHHHVAGFLTLCRSAALKAEAEVHPRFDPESVAGSGADYVSLVPTMLIRLLDQGRDIRGFKAILLGGGPIPAGLIERAAAAGARVVRSYGMTETCGGVLYDGAPLRGVEVRTDADDVIEISSPTLMSGYRNDPERTDASFQGGWFKTSDIGEWDGNILNVLGRADDMIVTGGEKVSPSAVEARLLTHPDVEDVAVMGTPDSEWGSAVTAFVVLKPGAPASPLEEWRDFVRADLPYYAAPRAVHMVSSIPRSETGKLDRPALISQAD